MTEYDWRDIYEFWFPASLADADHEALIKMLRWWMAGGATPELAQFLPVVEAARRGELEHWRSNPAGCLSLIIVLDQFPRGLFAGTPAAYSSDPAALALALEGLRNGDYEAQAGPWHRSFFLMPLTHTEGPGHLQRLEKVVVETELRIAGAPEHLKSIFEFGKGQAEGHLDVIRRFGRFPHRNAILGRSSSVEELAYLEKGEFVHNTTRRPRSPGQSY